MLIEKGIISRKFEREIKESFKNHNECIMRVGKDTYRLIEFEYGFFPLKFVSNLSWKSVTQEYVNWAGLRKFFSDNYHIEDLRNAIIIM